MLKQYWATLLKKIQKRIRILRIRMHNRAAIKKWNHSGRHYPPPHEYLEETIKFYAQKYTLHILVETGTFLGKMPETLQDDFEKIYTIELNLDHYLNAKEKFYLLDHIDVIKGDSTEQLPILLNAIHQPAIFWLDTNASLEKGLTELSILKELEAILKSKFNHLILINDARLFSGTGKYPSLIEIRNFITTHRPEYHFEVENDVVRVFVQGER